MCNLRLDPKQEAMDITFGTHTIHLTVPVNA